MMIHLRLQNGQPVSVLKLQSGWKQGKHFKRLINRLLNVRNAKNKPVYHVVWKAAGGLQFVCVVHSFQLVQLICQRVLSCVHDMPTLT